MSLVNHLDLLMSSPLRKLAYGPIFSNTSSKKTSICRWTKNVRKQRTMEKMVTRKQVQIASFTLIGSSNSKTPKRSIFRLGHS